MSGPPPITSNTIQIGPNAGKLNEININLFLTSTSFTTDSTKDGLLLTLSENSAGKTNALQLSMIVITIREYTSSTYPLQGVFVDNFNANTFIDASPTTPPVNTQVLPGTFSMTRSLTNPYYDDIE